MDKYKAMNKEGRYTWAIKVIAKSGLTPPKYYAGYESQIDAVIAALKFPEGEDSRLRVTTVYGKENYHNAYDPITLDMVSTFYEVGPPETGSTSINITLRK